jgi:hypothetical protein
MGEHEKEGRVKKSRILLIKSELGSEIIPGVIEGMDFIHPEGLLIKSIESQSKTNQEDKNKENNFLSICLVHSRETSITFH